VVFTEYYPSSLFAAHDTLTTSTYTALNIGILTGETQTLDQWYMTALGSKKFLTDSPLIQPIRASERIQLGFITSETDPIVKVKETKNNLTNATTSYALPDTSYYTYLWDYTVDADEVVTLASNVTTAALKKYVTDSDHTRWGGVRFDTPSQTAEIVLGTIFGARYVFNLRYNVSAGAISIYYFYSGSYHLSALSPTVGTGYGTFMETLPVGTTKIKVEASLIIASADILYGWILSTSDDVVNKSCQFTLDTSHVDSDTKQLEIWVVNAANDVMSEVKTFLVDTQPVDQTTRFCWQNLRGRMDYYTFKFGHTEDFEVEKITFLKELPLTFTKADRQKVLLM